jgi:hypothetical protein
MAVETAADRAVFLAADDFGVEAVYTPAGGAAGPTFCGLFDAPTISVAVGDEAETLDARATFFCRAADLPEGAEGGAGDTITLGDATYEVAAIEPDGQGMTLLRLARA